jgi:hypothetical protein
MSSDPAALALMQSGSKPSAYCSSRGCNQAMSIGPTEQPSIESKHTCSRHATPFDELRVRDVNRTEFPGGYQQGVMRFELDGGREPA